MRRIPPALLALAASLLPAASAAQAQAQPPATGWPLSWLFFGFAIAAVLAVVAVAILLVRWSGSAPRAPGR
jgi:hypothetical protein